MTAPTLTASVDDKAALHGPATLVESSDAASETVTLTQGAFQLEVREPAGGVFKFTKPQPSKYFDKKQQAGPKTVPAGPVPSQIVSDDSESPAANPNCIGKSQGQPAASVQACLEAGKKAPRAMTASETGLAANPTVSHTIKPSINIIDGTAYTRVKLLAPPDSGPGDLADLPISKTKQDEISASLPLFSTTTPTVELERRQELTPEGTKVFQLQVFKLFVDRLALEGQNLTELCALVNVTALTNDGVDGDSASSYLCAKATAPTTSTTASITADAQDLTSVPIKTEALTSVPLLTGSEASSKLSSAGLTTSVAAPTNAKDVFSGPPLNSNTLSSAYAASNATNSPLPTPLPSRSISKYGGGSPSSLLIKHPKTKTANTTLHHNCEDFTNLLVDGHTVPYIKCNKSTMMTKTSTPSPYAPHGTYGTLVGKVRMPTKHVKSKDGSVTRSQSSKKQVATKLSLASTVSKNVTMLVLPTQY
ncbi:MAG: hypothetical protein M1833_005762 [Piccolia ochrophora]|nr:MAG: hypothetical protein M1833_005762 [Piccolia ochrophora]